MSWFNNFSLKFLKVEDSDKVLDVIAQDYSHRNICFREDSLVLYSPSQKSNKFEIVLHRPLNETLTEAFSVCRYTNFQTAQDKFLIFKDKLPVLVSIRKSLYTTAQIQKICDLLMQNPTWNLAHLAVGLNQAELLKFPNVQAYINEEDEQNGMSPLQLAIQTENIKMVQALLNHNASLDQFDHQNNSVLHYAASTNKQIVNLLCENSKNTINSRNCSGRTPLHVACSADKRDCVHALLEAGADVNISVTERRSSLRTPGCVGPIKNFPKTLHGDDIKYGGTPLHWACSREVIEALVNKNCDINSLNFDQRTALHVMVVRNRLDCLVTLLSLKADCNIGDKDGNTPLHLAVQQGNEACVKALVVFGADLDHLNNKKELPRHAINIQSETGRRILYVLHSVGAPRCPWNQTLCNDGCSYNSTFIGTNPSQQINLNSRDVLDSLLSIKRCSPSRKKGRLLSLDGGGIRGLVLIIMLMELEKHFERPIYECFDWIAGTSTGGILALALALKIPLFDCLCLYFKLKDEAFTGKRPYATDTFENILKKALGEKTSMADLSHPKLMITATLVDRLPVVLHIFRNYPSPLDILKINTAEGVAQTPWDEHLLWQTARATGAAPTYFRAFGKFLDGGLISNNPTLDALTEIEEYNAALTSVGREDEVLPVSLVVSLGTGIIPAKELTSEVDVFRPESVWDAGRLVFGVSTMGNILVDQATQAEGRVVDRGRAWCSSMKIPFFRFSPYLSENVGLDEKSNEKLTNMLWESKAYMISRLDEVVALANILKELS